MLSAEQEGDCIARHERPKREVRMAESIRDKVAIVGMGCTRFGERWDASLEDLLVEAGYEAFEDAKLEAGREGGQEDNVSVSRRMRENPPSMIRKIPSLTLTNPESTTNLIPSIVTLASATFVEKMTLRVPGGAGSKMRVCSSACRPAWRGRGMRRGVF